MRSRATQTSTASDAIQLFRVVAADDASTAFSETCKPREGRWTTAHTAVVYASRCCSCAMLEFLAHLEGPPNEALCLVQASLPRMLLSDVGPLPCDWRERPYRPHVQAIGDAWAEAGLSVALEVPSAISPKEHNVLINIGHRDAGLIAGVHATALELDPRLWQRQR